MKRQLSLLLHLFPILVAKQDTTSLSLCCPEGTAYKENPDYDYDSYPDVDPRTCQPHPEQDLIYEDSTVFLKGGDEKFQCGKEQSGIPIPDRGWEVNLLVNSSLKVSNENYSKIYNPADFCLHFTTSPDYYDYDWQNGTIRSLFFVCDPLDLEKQPTELFFSVMMYISAFFIFITLVIYCYLKDTRKKRFGQLTIGFLFNILIAFICSAIQRSMDPAEVKGFLGCKILGFCIQHFWLGFFFWISAMAINITHTFAKSFRNSSRDEASNKSLLLHILYAQGVPLFITIITIMMDTMNISSDYIVPGMGDIQCFFGHEKVSDAPSFFKTPSFLYFYLIISIIMVSNLLCFLITGYNLISHWVQMKDLQTSANDSNGNGPFTQLRILVTLFILMGVPWILEVVSAATNPAWEYSLLLNIINLCQGILIFLVLVCKASVLSGLKERLKGAPTQDSRTYKTSVASIMTRKISRASTSSVS